MKNKKAPLVGVLTGKKTIKQLEKQHTPINIKLFTDANKKIRTGLFFFPITRIDFEKHQIEGMFFCEKINKWKIKIFYFPDILYKRGGVLPQELNKLNNFLYCMEKYNMRPLNSLNSLSKWPIYKHLLKYNGIKHHLPKTVLFKSSDNLEFMLNKFDSIYLKASNGRLGKKIIKVNKTVRGFECLYFRKTPKRIFINKYQDMLDIISAFFKHEHQVIIQKTIDLLRVNNRLLDIRAEVQRNGQGNLDITGLPVRIAKESSPITQHANSLKFEDFFKNTMKYTDDKIQKLYLRIKDLIFKTYPAIEDFCGKSAELGIDLGVDKNNRVYFIEANSQPTKVSLKKAYGDIAIQKSYESLLSYAKFINSAKLL